jgi:anti-anti-sigma regulatory factor
MQKKLGAGLKLVNVQELVMEVFEMTGFCDILTIE